MTDIVRVLRILEYTGPRAAIEAHLQKTLKGTKSFSIHEAHKEEFGFGSSKSEYLGNITIREATLGNYPEILDSGSEPDP